MHGHAGGEQRFADGRLDGGNVIEAGVLVAGELDVLVARVGVGDREQVPAAHGDSLLCGGEAAVVAHDAAHEAGAKQHIGAFEQLDRAACLAGRQGSRAARPAAADDDDFFSHNYSSSLASVADKAPSAAHAAEEQRRRWTF